MFDAAAHPHARSAPLWGHGPVPGLLLTGAIAAAAFAIHALPGFGPFSPLILSIIIGIALHNTLGTPARSHAGVKFALRRVLRLGIILLGLQLTAQQVVAVGWRGLLVILPTLFLTFAATKWFGRLLGVDHKLAELIGAGTAICGASAVIATNTVTQGSDEDVAYAVACVTVFGSASMLLYPLLPAVLHLTPHQFGLWAGASIHEIAQVVAAAFQNGRDAGEFATITKLSRVMLLAPLVFALGALAARRRRRHGHAHGGARAPLPWFVLGFIALIGINSFGVMPAAARAFTTPFTTFLLAIALAAMGLETDLRKLRAAGLRPLALGAASWLFVGCLSLALIELVD
jgi:uncharacterized integral membrane protein (TIGR00698 family)